jgi:heme-degrading monooxygenase HmoA
MIMRVYRCTVVAGKEAEFRAYAFGKSHPRLKEHAGLMAFYAARPMPGTADRTRCMVQIWESAAAIEAALGENWREPPSLSPEAGAFIDSASVEYYELADEYRAAEGEMRV